MVRDVLVKHRVIVGNSKQIASQNTSRQRKKAFCDGICIEKSEKCSYGFLSHSAQRAEEMAWIHIPKEINLVLLKGNFFKKNFLESKNECSFVTLEGHIMGKI